MLGRTFGLEPLALAYHQEWLEWQLVQPDWAVQLDENWMFLRILLVARRMNAALRQLYESGAWLPARRAATIGKFGVEALRAYGQLAEHCLQAGLPRFPLYPKFHMLLHQFYGLSWQAEKLSWVENPLTDSCQMCESFIGGIARLSRRVSPKSTIERTMDLYLMTLWKHWSDN